MVYKDLNQRQLSVVIDKDLLRILKAMHVIYNKKQEKRMSFASFIQSALENYLKSVQGKALLLEVYNLKEGYWYPNNTEKNKVKQ